MGALAQAERLGGADGPYVLQAALAASHARALKTEEVDWARISMLYDRLREVAPSPVVDLNRAVAYGMAFGPEVGLRLVDEIAGEAVLRNYAPLPAVKGDLLLRAGCLAEARLQFEIAACMTRNSREAAFLISRAITCMASA
jgi:predicted RNA polymerase sigma factor